MHSFDKLWISFAQSVECRDKFLRLIYFACCFSHAHFEDRLSLEVKERLDLTIHTTSIARKAFRLLKSFSHISKILELTIIKEDLLYAGDPEIITELLTQICWTICFYYDNKVFLSRTKIINFNEGANFQKFSYAWCAADLFSIIGSLLSLKHLIRKRNVLLEAMKANIAVQIPIEEQKFELEKINSLINFHILRLIKNILNAIVSGEFSGLWKFLFSQGLGRQIQGICGVVSSLLAIYEEMNIVLEGDTRDSDFDAAIINLEKNIAV